MVDNAIQVVLSRSTRRCCQAVRARHFHCLLYTYQLALLRATNPNSYYTGNTELCCDMWLTGKITSSLGLFTHYCRRFIHFSYCVNTLHMVCLTKKCWCLKMYLPFMLRLVYILFLVASDSLVWSLLLLAITSSANSIASTPNRCCCSAL